MERFIVGFLIGATIGYMLATVLDPKSKLIGKADPKDPLGATAEQQ